LRKRNRLEQSARRIFLRSAAEVTITGSRSGIVLPDLLAAN